jgi:hypothetical protein
LSTSWIVVGIAYEPVVVCRNRRESFTIIPNLWFTLRNANLQARVCWRLIVSQPLAQVITDL